MIRRTAVHFAGSCATAGWRRSAHRPGACPRRAHSPDPDRGSAVATPWCRKQCRYPARRPGSHRSKTTSSRLHRLRPWIAPIAILGITRGRGLGSRRRGLGEEGRAGYHKCMLRRPIRILGIDPGLRRTGWGVVEIDGNRLTFIACGSVSSDDKAGLALRLLAIHDGLFRIVEEFVPDEAAVEATFVNKDAAATLKLGQARGIAMLVPALAGLSVAEYAPNAVKKAVIGVGHGEKQQIQMMVRVLLPKAKFAGDDAADALAIAICHAHH